MLASRRKEGTLGLRNVMKMYPVVYTVYCGHLQHVIYSMCLQATLELHGYTTLLQTNHDRKLPKKNGKEKENVTDFFASLCTAGSQMVSTAPLLKAF